MRITLVVLHRHGVNLLTICVSITWAERRTMPMGWSSREPQRLIVERVLRRAGARPAEGVHVLD